MTNAITQFFTDDGLLPHDNSNTIVFIHKFYNAYFIDHIRLIAMANFKHKIVTKILVDKLTSLHIRAWLSNIFATNKKISSLHRGNVYNGACISEKLKTLWLESDFKLVVQTFINYELVPWKIKVRWKNYI